ncbi:MAG TPA: DoxX family protein [Stellaceae bacterium]|nr:DoxX family protein [Stellaceae bacterium]
MAEARTAGEPKLYFPFLRSFYDAVTPLAWPIVRIAVGWNLTVHGWEKVMAGPAAIGAGFGKMGFHAPFFLAVLITCIEFVGGLCIMAGFFTRFFAAAIAIELGYITLIIFGPNGFDASKRGYEYPLMWGAIFFAIALRGGGPYSLDRRINREL